MLLRVTDCIIQDKLAVRRCAIQSALFSFETSAEEIKVYRACHWGAQCHCLMSTSSAKEESAKGHPFFKVKCFIFLKGSTGLPGRSMEQLLVTEKGRPWFHGPSTPSFFPGKGYSATCSDDPSCRGF